MNETAPAEAGARIERDVLANSNAVHRWLREHGYTDSAARIGDTAARWKDTSATVVVAGDVKRGKSSLVNVVLRRPGLLPVDADEATGVHLVVRGGPADAASVTLLGEDATTKVEPVALAELGRYASMSGDEALRERVVDVTVELSDPLLDGMTLVDTPGVGSLTPGHRDATLSAVSRADALVFTVSSETPVSRSEIEFLVEAAGRIDRLVVCVTKSDLATADAVEAMVAADRGRIADWSAALGRDGDARGAAVLDRVLAAPFLTISAHLAERSLQREAAGRHDTAADLMTRSGLDGLVAWLSRATGMRAQMRLANLSHLVTALLDDAADAESAKAAAASGDPAGLDELARQRVQLESLMAAQARWRGTLAGAIGRMQTEVGRAVTGRLNVVRNQYRHVFETSKGRDVDALAERLPDELERSLHAAWCDLALVAEQAFAAAIAEVAADLEVDLGDDSTVVISGLGDPRDFAALVAASRGERDAGEFTLVEDGIPMATQAMSLAGTANAVAALLGISTGGLGFVAYGVGAAISWPLVALRRRHRRRTQTVQDWNRVVGETLFGTDGIAREFAAELNLKVMDGRERFERLVDEALTQRRRNLEARARDLQGAVKADAAKRAELHAQAEARTAEIARMRVETDALAHRVRQMYSA